MKKIILNTALFAFAVAPAMAQETYESATLMAQDLNGTARYVGMGGAMEALGADISTIGSNPAGIGLFRKSSFNTSFGVNMQPENGLQEGKTTASFDQVGFVFTSRTNEDSWLNFAVNYSKSRDFNQILSAEAELKGGSQNKLTYIKALRGFNNQKGGFTPYLSKQGEYLSNDRTYTQNDYINFNVFNADENGEYGYYDASSFALRRDNSGYIGQYDINISGNSNNRLYWGFTVGIKDVHYHSTTQYAENLIDATNKDLGMTNITDIRNITGQGFYIAGGVIVRPIEDSPFRFGVSVTTPTWYELRSENDTYLDNSSCSAGIYSDGTSYESYKYKVYTPWKFGASIGHTVDNCLAFGVSYEYADYSTTDHRYITDEYYDSWSGTTDSNSESDLAMNEHTKQSLNGVSTLKAGLEYKINPEFAIRLGYNYVSPMYKTEAYRDGGINSDGCYYASTTDYTNWKSTNRITAGFGFAKDNFSFDLAYVYSTQKGTFFPFQEASANYYDDGKVIGKEINNTTACNVKNDRHKIMATLGWRF